MKSEKSWKIWKILENQDFWVILSALGRNGVWVLLKKNTMRTDERTDKHTSILGRSLHNKTFGQLDHTLLARYGPAGTLQKIQFLSLIDSRVKFNFHVLLILNPPNSCSDPKFQLFLIFLENTLRILTDFDQFLQFGPSSIQLFFTKKREKSHFAKSFLYCVTVQSLRSIFENEK